MLGMMPGVPRRGLNCWKEFARVVASACERDAARDERQTMLHKTFLLLRSAFLHSSPSSYPAALTYLPREAHRDPTTCRRLQGSASHPQPQIQITGHEFLQQRRRASHLQARRSPPLHELGAAARDSVQSDIRQRRHTSARGN